MTMMSDLSDNEFVASEPAAGAPVTGAVTTVADRRIATLVPDSTIQFLDAFVADAASVVVRRRYFEDAGSGAAESGALYVVSLDDGVFHHPVTRAVADAAQTYVVDGASALAAFAGTWLPIPLLRVLAPDTGLGAVLDQGPTNWARIHVSRAADEASEAAPGWNVVVALDTTITAAPGAKAHAAGPAPTLADVTSGTAFQFSADENDVGAFVTEAWVDDWIAEIYEEHNLARQRPGDAEWVQPRPLEHIAHYLTLLSVLAETGAVPAVRFRDTLHPTEAGAANPVDLALDIGAARTLALLRPAGGEADPAQAAFTPLALRDLSRPWLRHAGILPSRVEFARANFGREAHSRWSGRANAFYWPSLARVGIEAERLAAAQPSGADICGLASPLLYLWDEARRDEVWRFTRGEAGAEPATTQRGAIVAGPQLAQLTEAGDLVTAGVSAPATTKPRFSRASLTTFFAAEIILQALGNINAPQIETVASADATAQAAPAAEAAASGAGATKRPNRLARIVLTVPGNMADEERRRLRLRIENAIDLVWSGLGASATHARPRRPDVVFAADHATNAQSVYLYNEIAHKFRGRAREYFDLMGKTRPGQRSGRSLRIASFDIGAATTALSVATYDLADNGAMTREAELVDGLPGGGDDVLKAVVERHIMPALATRLAECGLTRPERLLARLFGGEPSREPAARRLACRFAAHLARPTATALLEEHAASRSIPDDVPVARTLAGLLAAADTDARTTADALDQIAAEEGADAFSPLSTPITFLHRELGETISQVLAPVLASAIRLVHALDCDVVLLSGWASRLPVVLDTLLEGLPTRPNRIVAMHDYRVAPWYPGRLASEKIADAKTTAAVGALIEHADVLRLAQRHTAPDAQRVIVGRLGPDGTIAADDVLFTLLPAAQARDAGTPLERTTTAALVLPAVIAARRVGLHSWPATPFYHLALKDTGRRDAPRQPLKITFERVTAGNGELDALTITKACDATGTPILVDELDLHAQSLREAAGSWLDTGCFALDATVARLANRDASGGDASSKDSLARDTHPKDRV